MSRILYSQQTPFGQMTKLFVNSLINAQLTSDRLVLVLNAIVGSPADYTQIESQLGVTAGQGQAFYNTITGLAATVNGAVGLATLDVGP